MRELTIEEVAGIYGVTTQTVRNWKRRGCPFEYKKDRLRLKLFFDKKEIDEWIEKEGKN